MNRVVAVGLLIVVAIVSLALIFQYPKRDEVAKTKAEPEAAVYLPEDFVATQPAPNRKYKLGVLFPFLGIPFWVNEAYGILDQAEKVGVDVVWLSSDGYQNIEKQNSQIEDLVTLKVDAILLAATSYDGTVPAVKKAVAAGIPVITHVSPSNTDVVSATVTTDDRAIGQKQGEYVCGKLNQGKVAMLSGPAAADWSSRRAAGFKEALQKGCSKVSVVAERFGNPGRAESQREAEDILVTFRELDAIFTAGDAMAMGVADAVSQARLNRKIYLTTAGFFRETLPFLRAGQIDMAVDESAILNGRVAVNTAVRLLNGEKVQKRIFVPTPVRTSDDISGLDENRLWPPKDWKLK